ncbi:DNA starvation/stationary phase protection protein, partial [Pseudoalteromonas sp. S2893]
KYICVATAAVEYLLAGYSTLIKLHREGLTQAVEVDDEWTESLMGDYI